MTKYLVYLNGTSPVTTSCTTSPCFYAVEQSASLVSYAVIVASINGQGVGPNSTSKAMSGKYCTCMNTCVCNT